jgi:Flp pilus assembly protein TadG
MAVQRFRRIIALARDTRGVNMLEAAIITPLLVLLTFGIIDFGALIYVDVTLQNGISQATRYAVTGRAAPGMTREDSVRAAMKRATPTLTIDDASIEFQHMAMPGNGAWVNGAGGPNDIQKVTVNYSWDILTPVIRPFFTDGQVRFQVESVMKNEGLFE